MSMKWSTYEEYIDECGEKFADGIIKFYTSRKYRKLMPNQKFENVTNFVRNYFVTHLDVKSRWAAARLDSDEYTENYVRPETHQKAIYDLAKRYLTIYFRFYSLAEQGGLDYEILLEDTKRMVEFTDKNYHDEDLLRKNFKLANLNKTFEKIIGSNKESQLGE